MVVVRGGDCYKWRRRCFVFGNVCRLVEEVAVTLRVPEPNAPFFRVGARTIRRVIKAHRGARGLGAHARSYALSRVDALALGLPRDLGVSGDALPEDVVLSVDDAAGVDGASPEAMSQRWRGVFHARVHAALERNFLVGAEGAARLRARIDALGQVEFDEVRAMLDEDDRVLSPADDREHYIEFAAMFCEYVHFEPTLLATTFPSLADPARVLSVLRQDLDDRALFEVGCPDSVGSRDERGAASKLSVGYATYVAHAKFTGLKVTPPSVAAARIWVSRAEAAAAGGNDAGAALDAARACTVEDAEVKSQAERILSAAAYSLERRVMRVAQPVKVSLKSLLELLARAASRAGRYSKEARLLLALQTAALAGERVEQVVDIPGFLFSLGRKKVVRGLPMLRELRAVHALRRASVMAYRVRLEFAQRSVLVEVLDVVSGQADLNLRDALRPTLRKALEVAGLRASNSPELVARDKVIEEWLDDVSRRGFVSFGSIRDGLSRNQLKLDDLAGVTAVFRSDPLLRLDRIFDVALDGAYRKSDFYLRWLHIASRLLFATGIGRALMVFAIVPVLGAFVVLQAYGHVVLPHLGKLSFAKFDPTTTTAFATAACFIFGLLHSPGLRGLASQVLGLIGGVLAFLFSTVPRLLFGHPALRRWLAQPRARFVIRGVVVPAAVALASWRWMHTHGHEAPRELALGAVGLFALAMVLWSRLGEWIEETIFEQVVPAWHQVGRKFLFGIARVVARFFEALLDGLERGMFRVEEALHFRGAAGPALLAWKGAAGVAFGLIAYVVRLYVTLMVEPEVNPIKHVPVVTVAHKLTLPFMSDLLAFLRDVASPLGPVIGGSFAVVTAFFAPSAFGFLAWELKENYKLYRGGRRGGQPPALVGAHGETVRALLVPGFHSGTLSKLFRRLRRSAERESLAALDRRLVGKDRSGVGATRSLRGIRDDLRTVETRVRWFVERELCGMLNGPARWAHGRVSVGAVQLSASRIRVELTCNDLSQARCTVAFEAQSANVIATVERPGFLTALLAAGGDSVTLFENALVGLYHAAEVDFVREQVEANIPTGRRYDFDDQGIVVWPTPTFDVQLRFPVHGAVADIIEPEVVGVGYDEPSWVLDLRKVAFARTRVGWAAWVAAWSAAAHPTARIPRLALGESLLARGEQAE